MEDDDNVEEQLTELRTQDAEKKKNAYLNYWEMLKNVRAKPEVGSPKILPRFQSILRTNKIYQACQK